MAERGNYELKCMKCHYRWLEFGRRYTTDGEIDFTRSYVDCPNCGSDSFDTTGEFEEAENA